MKTPEPEYYNRQVKLNAIGVDGQEVLKNSHVVIIGAGGLGCPCLTYLATSGIGNIIIVDFDVVSISNLHRQILFSFPDIGKNKAETAKNRLKQINPFINIEPLPIKINAENILGVLKKGDVIIDATDNFFVRYLINDACVFLNKPLVYGAVYQTEGHLSVFNYNNSPQLRDLFPENESNNLVPACNDAGVYGIITGLIGIMMAGEAIKLLLKMNDILTGRLLCFNGLSFNNYSIKYRSKKGNNDLSKKRFVDFNKNLPLEISTEDYEKVISNNDIVLIDVREDFEREICHIGGLHIPMGQIAYSINTLNIDDKIIVYCHHGIRSLQVVDYLRGRGFNFAQSLEGGIHKWAIEKDESLARY